MIRGSCLCGTVTYEFEGPVEEAHHCHCSRCRKFHGAAFGTYARANASGLRVVGGGERLKEYRSSAPVRRSFCAECGSSLFFAHEAAPQFVWVAAGTLDEGEDEAKPDAHIFAPSKARWWSIEDSLPRHEGHRPE
jgi:hypothetical protein